MRCNGPWSAEEVERFLAASRVPLRLAVHGATGHPVLVSLWFLPEAGRLWCATQRTARVASLLARDPRCALEVAPDAPPYHGVRGQAVASLHPERGAEVLGRLIDRYLGDRSSRFAKWLLDRAGRESAIALTPRRLTSWDYRARMRAG
jgi:hypothetical protein